MKRIFFCFLLTLLTTPAWAQAIDAKKKEQARELFVRGVERMKVDDWSGALTQLEEAYQIAPYAVILYNMGIAYEQLDRPVDAVRTMNKVLASPGTLKSERVARAKESVAEQSKRIGKLTVAVSESGASIRIDGREIGKTPLSEPALVNAGTRYIEVFRSGFVPYRRELNIAGGSAEKMDVALTASDKPLAQIWVRTDLPDAEIWLDGKRIGITPLEQSLPVEPGEHRVELKRRGYDDARDLIDVGPGATANVRLDPRQNEDAIRTQGGLLELVGEAPDDLVLTIDGKRYGPYAGSIALAPGAHDLTIERAGFLPANIRVSIASGSTTTRDVLLDPTPETVADHNAEVALYRGLGWTFTAVGAAALAGGVGFMVWNESDISDREAAYNPKLEMNGEVRQPRSELHGAGVHRRSDGAR